MASRARPLPHRGPIDLLEAAYDVAASPESWLHSLLDHSGPILPPRLGMAASFLDASGPQGLVTAGPPFRPDQVVDALGRVPSETMRRLYFTHGRVATTMSEAARRIGMGPRELDAILRLLTPPEYTGQIKDFVGVFALDAEGQGVLLTAPLEREKALDRATRRRWTLLGVHLATAARLRRGLAATKPAPVAILRPDGRVEHAEDDVKSRPSREALSARAVAIDRARGRLRRSDPDGALDMWRGLVTGRWSLVDRFDSDGRRFVVAHVNEPVPAKMLALTLRERQVVGHVLVGHSSKLVAYALGISPAAVSSSLRSALLKLGVGSVAKLVERLGATAAEHGVDR